MSVTVYGIKNCDSMKKAFSWLEERGVPYVFHDYKTRGVDVAVLRRAVDVHGWEAVLNRKGTTWRRLPDEVRNAMTAEQAIETAAANPSVVKRPLLVAGPDIVLGFDGKVYRGVLG